MEDILK